MTRTRKPKRLSVALAALLAGTAGAGAASSFDEGQTADIQAIVRDYIVKNPEVLIEALDSLEAKRAAAQQAGQKQAIDTARQGLLASPDGTVLGNPQGDVTVVEFFDYNCGYCKRAMADMEGLIKSDPKLRFVLKEIPVLGDDSVAASHVSLAFRHVAPDRYGEFHKRLLGSKGVANEERALGVAEDLGVGEADMRAAMASSEVKAVLDENARLASLLKINGTPSYVISDEVVAGAIGKDGLKSKIENVRRCASTSC